MSEIFRQERSEEALVEPTGQQIERLHRYYLAREFARGREVLDIRAGDGSGAAVLAQTAGRVIAITSSAAAATFPGIEVSTAVEAGAMFDLIIAFDAIEHVPDPDSFLADLRAKLRPEGSLLLATPDRGLTPAFGVGLHQHEFTRDGLTQVLGRHFSHVHVLAQRGLIGSAIVGAPGNAPTLMVEHRGEVQAAIGPVLRADGLFVVAASRPIEGIANSLFIHADIDLLAQIQARFLRARSTLQDVQAEHDILRVEVDRVRRADSGWRHELAVHRVNEAAANNRYVQARAQFEAAERQYAHVLAKTQIEAASAAAAIAATISANATTIAANAGAMSANAAALAAATALAASTAQEEQRRVAADGEARRRVEMRAEAFEAECGRLRGLLQQAPAGMRGRLTRRLRRVLGGGPAPGSAIAARAAAIAASDTFDAVWYRRYYYDVGIAGMDPATHYLRHGAAEDRNPNPDFDSAWFRAEHPELGASGLTPAEFHERSGRLAGWPTKPTRPVVAIPAIVVPPPSLPEPELVPAPEALADVATAVESMQEAPEPVPERETAAQPETEAAPLPKTNPRVLFVSGEPETPGNDYRCVRYAAAAEEAGWTAGWSKLGETGAIELVGVEIVVLWRVRYSEHVRGIMWEVRRQNGIVVFDVDDLMIRPEFARPAIIDGMRTISAGVAATRATFMQIQQTMGASDICTTTTEELAEHMRAWQKAAYILPNGFDDATHARGRRAVRERALAPGDRLIRIGYAAGTVTHQKDFAQALPGLLRVLETRPDVRLVLFRATDGTELVIVDEFEELAKRSDQIEWRDKVELDGLPAEIARFDINIAPLEIGNPFCEAKSELKYFEAALVDVPTVASPTGPFARAIVEDRTGLLAADDDAWHEQVLRLVDDAGARQRIGRAAYVDCLWRFGPRRRAEIVGSFLEQITGTTAGARAFALDVQQEADRRIPDISFNATETLFRVDRLGQARVSVIIPCFNYADFIIEALESVRLQTLEVLDLVVVDDCSTDPLATEEILVWCERHQERFNRLIVLRHLENSGLSASRNTGFAAAETPFVMPLDADNRLHPTCCETLLATMEATRAAYAYPILQKFGAADDTFCCERYQPARFTGGNYIDAMAMIAKWAWAAAGGYNMPRTMGWEDFELWCRLAELGQRGVHVPEILADYRVHGGSMVASVVEVDVNKQEMVALMEQRHDWLRLSSRTPTERV